MDNSQTKTELLAVDSELESLTDTELDELYFRLKYFTYKYYKSLAYPNSILEDLIHDSIIDAWVGNRKRPEDCPLFNFICGIIRSNVSHFFEKEKRRAELLAIKNKTNGSGHSYTPSFDKQDLRERVSSSMTKIKNDIKGDYLLNIIHKSFLNDPEVTPSEIAENYNLSLTRVKSVLKRYLRIARKRQVA